MFGADPLLVLVVGGSALFVMLVSGMSILAVVAARPRLALKKRLEAYGLTKHSSGGGEAGKGANIRQRRIHDKLQELEEKKAKKQSRRVQIRLDLLQAGIDVSIQKYFVLVALLGLGASALTMMMGFNFFIAAMAGLAGAFGLPKLVLTQMARARQKQFTAHFANAIDVVVRGIKSGLPVGECLAIVGRESPEPVGEEFRRLVEGQKIGLAIDELMERGLERLPTPEYKFFSIVLLIQQQTGGNLANTLENLSNVLRERKKLKDKVKALSSEAKASAMIIGSLPFFVAGMVSLLNPEYMRLLFTETAGNFMLAAGLSWMAVGVAVMSKMINFKV